jgi:hypothetical protein
VDGYCCNSTCAGSCQACDIVGSIGTCTNVNSGAPHGNHPPCGNDVNCLGTCLSGQCAFSPKPCGDGPSCSGNDYVGQSTCIAGSCVKPTATACSNGYTCSGTSCLNKCTGTSGCIPSHYCENSVCTLKKNEGDVCMSAAECSSGNCSGRCCKTGFSCNCVQPNPNNLISNAGFDKDLSSWTFLTSSGKLFEGAQRVADDATGCPYSGSVRMVSGSAEIFQCVNVAQSTNYQIGIQWKFADPAGPTNYVHCLGYLFNGATCPGLYFSQTPPDASMVFDISSNDNSTTWPGFNTANQGSVFSSTYSRFLIGCLIGGEGPTDVFFDMWHVTPIPPGGY